MKIAYTAPAKSELYAIERKAAVRVVRSLCPALRLLAFQTMHVPKMDSDIPYLATFSVDYIRLLSVRAEFMSADLQVQIYEEVLPYICNTILERRESSYSWPSVIVIFKGVIREANCSDGGLFPNRAEIIQSSKKYPRSICTSMISHNSEQNAARQALSRLAVKNPHDLNH